jgi:hypothetical protein
VSFERWGWDAMLWLRTRVVGSGVRPHGGANEEWSTTGRRSIWVAATHSGSRRAEQIRPPRSCLVGSRRSEWGPSLPVCIPLARYTSTSQAGEAMRKPRGNGPPPAFVLSGCGHSIGGLKASASFKAAELPAAPQPDGGAVVTRVHEESSSQVYTL